MEVIKIRLQAQHHSMADPLDIPKYRNAAHALYTVLKEEGVGALYRGVSLTALRQGTYLPFPFPRKIYTRPVLTQETRLQPSRKLYRLHGIQTAAPKMATRIRRLPAPVLPNDFNRPRLRRHGSPLQRAH